MRIICIDNSVCLGKITTPKLFLGHVFLLKFVFTSCINEKLDWRLDIKLTFFYTNTSILVDCLESIILKTVHHNQVIFTDWLHLAIIHIVAYALTLLSSSRNPMNLLMKKQRFTHVLKVLFPFLRKG